MTSTPSPQQGIWTLTAPDGRTWRADSPLKAVSAEQRERVPAKVAVDRIFAACEEAQPAVLAVPGWRPIDEAPKDGSMILLGMPDRVDDDGGEVSTPGYWQKGWEDSVDDMGCDDGFVDVHFQEFSPPRSFGAEAYRSKGRQPTHWMPLPPAPTEAT